MSAADIFILILFVIIVFVTGMSFSASGKDMRSFFAAGGAVPWWISGLSLFMSFFSAGTFVVWGSIAYTQGAVSLSIQWTMALAGVFIALFIAARWQKTGVLTAAEYLTRRLGYHYQKYFTWLFLAISVFTTGAFLYPVAKIVEVSTGIDLQTAIVILGLLVILYTATGGLWAVIVTDVLQFVVLTVAVLVVVPLAFRSVGGWGEFTSGVPADFFQFVNHEYSALFLIAFGLYNLIFIGGNWAYVQRYTSVATPREAKKVGFMFGALYVISPVIWMLPPMIYRVLQPDLSGLADEGAYLLISKEVLPAGMLGLVLGGMVFATASSVNTTLNIAAGVLTNDVFRHFFPHADDKKIMIVARLSTLFFGLLTITVALLVPFMGGIVEVVLSVAAITGGAMYMPLLWSLFSPWQNGKSILTVTVVSLLVNVFFKFFTPVLFDLTLLRAAEMGMGVGLPALLLFISEIILWKRKNPSPGFKEIFNQENDGAKILETKQSTANQSGIRKLGLGVAAVGLLMFTLGFYVSEDGLYLIIASLPVLVTAFFMWHKSKSNP